MGKHHLNPGQDHLCVCVDWYLKIKSVAMSCPWSLLSQEPFHGLPSTKKILFILQNSASCLSQQKLTTLSLFHVACTFMIVLTLFCFGLQLCYGSVPQLQRKDYSKVRFLSLSSLKPSRPGTLPCAEEVKKSFNIWVDREEIRSRLSRCHIKCIIITILE